MACPGQISAQPGGGSVTLSPGEDCETACIDCESQRKRSRKLIPLSFKGARVAILLRTSKLAPSTPTVKKAKDFAASPCLTWTAAACQGSPGSGPPSVM